MDKKEIEQHIVNFPLFKGLFSEEIKKILEQGFIVHFSKDEVVFHEGNIGSQVYIILEGVIGIYQEGKEITRLSEGEIFGEMALLTRQPRSATAKAIENSSLFVFSETTFEKLLKKKTAVRLLLNIIHILCERLRHTTQTIKT